LDGLRLSDIYDSGLIDAYITEFCRASAIPRSNVFPVVNFRGAWDQRDYVKEKLILNAFYNAFKFAQRKVSSLLESKIVVINKSDPNRPQKVAFLDRGGTDEVILPLTERIARVPGLGDFQIFLNNSTTVVQKGEYSQVKLLECAKASSHGYYELYGQLPKPQAPTPAPAPTAAPQATPTAAPAPPVDNTPREIAIFVDDPHYPNNRAFGCITTLSINSNLAALRSLIMEELEEEMPTRLGGKFQFVKLGGPSTGSKLNLVPMAEEGATKIANAMLLTKQACVQIAKPLPVEIGIRLDGTTESLGFVEDVPLTTKLDSFKSLIKEQTEIEFEFRFLTIDRNPLTLRQETTKTLGDILVNGTHVVVAKKVVQ